MRRWSTIFLLLILPSCGPAADAPERQVMPEQPIVWPEPPQMARIRLVSMFSGPEDLGINPSFIARIWEWIAGPEPRAMVRPYAVGTDGERLVVTDPGAGAVHVFDMNRRDYERIDRAGDQALVSPVGVALADGNLYVSDSALNEIFIFDSKGKLKASVAGLQRPTGLAIDPQSGRLYVAETMNHRIVVFDRNGARLFDFGKRGIGDGEFNFPSHLTIHGDRIYVNDTMNFRLQVFSLDGIFQSTFGRQGDGSGSFAHPKGVGLDSEGHVYVVDALFDRVQIFDDQGRFLLAFGEPGGTPGAFWLPSGLFILGDRIYVADSYNRRVQVFQFLGGA